MWRRLRREAKQKPGKPGKGKGGLVLDAYLLRNNLPDPAMAAYRRGVSKKSAKIAAMIEGLQGRRLDAHYLGYFECFNQGLFYESHDVLEELWLADRQGPNGSFYKGLIQFAGAFVHLQKHSEQRPRLRPAAALLKLARANLGAYPAVYEHLDVGDVLQLIEEWLQRLEAGGFAVNPLTAHCAPRLLLIINP